MEYWRKEYEQKLCTAEEAIKLIKSGDHVVIGHYAAEPAVLVDAMVKNADAYRDVSIHQMITLGPAKYAQPQYKDNFFFDGWYVSESTRDAVAGGYGDVTFNNYYQIGDFLIKGIYKNDVTMIMVSPPNEKGFVSLGVSVDYTLSAIYSAKTVIAQVNSRMPFTYGDTLINISQFDCIVEADQELYEASSPAPDDVMTAIAGYCAELIPDRATISMAAGCMNDVIIRALSDKKDLGIYSDILTDGMMELYEKGVITGKYCSTDPRIVVASCAAGSRKLYDFVNNNPGIMFHRAETVNHPYNLAQQSQFCGISTALQTDILGHVSSGCIGEYMLAGPGGQAGHIRGADLSMDKKGKAIIVMTSRIKDADDKIVSAIVPMTELGAEVSVPSEEAQFIVTEYGIADLRAKTSEERARALINIAAPEFIDELIENYVLRFKKEFS